MEGGGGEDDEGSGWFEVKKKNRTSSKLAIQKVSGGSSYKTQTRSSFQASPNAKVGNSCSRQHTHTRKDGVDYVVHAKLSSDVFCSSAVRADNGTDCLDKMIVNLENGPQELLPYATMEPITSEVKKKEIQDISIKEKLDVPKIKWGNLEDEAPSLSTVYGDSLNLETDCGASVASVSSSCIFYEGKLTMEAIELLPDDKLSSGVHGESLEGTWKEVTEIPSENLGSVNDPTYTSRIQYGDGVIKMNENEPEAGVGRNDPMLRDSPASPVEGTLEVVPQESHDTSEKGSFNVSEVDAMSVDRSMSVSIQDTISHQANAIEISGEASLISATGLRGLHNLTEGTYLGESEEGESKERFRERLWCFLFENLNRAVDELYLLCELECDMDQMIEAILILEEASTDFKELKCRVEHFENTKRSTTQLSKDGMPVTAKADHRRPHALSWEVRRMTTSPHRAEILSSSLEAFKKVQLERTRRHVNQDPTILSKSSSTGQHFTGSSPRTSNLTPKTREPNTQKQGGNLDPGQGNTKVEKSSVDAARQSRVSSVHNGRFPPQNLSTSAPGKSKRELLESISETEKQLSRKDKVSVETKTDKQLKANDIVKKQTSVADKEKEKERRNTTQWKPIDAWKEKRNWEDILKSPLRNSSRVSHSPGLARKGMERARVLHDKLMSPEKKRKTALDMKKEAEEKHARAMRIRSQLENERMQRLQRTSEKLNRVNEWQAVRSLKLREGMHARHRQSESRHEAYLAQVARRAGDESSKVNEVRFITSLNEENKKFILRQKLYDSEMRRAEKLQVIKTKQKEDTAREEAVLERRKLLEAEKLQRLAETQRKKEEAQVRREEERKASSAAREAKALEQLRKKEVRAKAQQEEAELLAQKLAERLSESEQRRKFYLEQIREKASMDFRDQSSPLLRRPLNKEGQSRPISTNSTEDYQTSFICSTTGDSIDGIVTATQQQSLKRRIKKIRQRLMALKYEFIEPPTSADNSMIGYRALVGTARAKIGRWLQDLQRLRQARKEGSASIGLIVGDMIKFLEGKDPELHASRQAGLLDFISSALPASHTSKPTACQVTIYLLRLLRVVLTAPANRTYFLVQNLLSPIIPMLSASLENYIKIAASFSPGSNNSLPSKTSTDNLQSIAEVLDGFLWTVTIIIGCVHTDERQLQMQDGLLELVVSYQIIHRLRDLFALYDRPQVEGNSFPSSILLSLNLLVALTSRSKIISPIDWEACISKAAPATKIQETKGFEYPATEEFSVGENSTKHVTADTPFVSALMSQEKLQLTVTGIPESKTLDGECRNESKEVANVLDDVGKEKKVGKSTSGDVLVFEENAKKNSSQKDENNLVDICAERKRDSELVVHDNIENRKDHGLKQRVAFFLYAIAETGLVGLPSLLTAVLLQANNRQSSEQASYILPSNFEEVATAVLKVLNNLALLDIVLLQRMLARPDLKMEFFHLMSFLLSYCTNKWRTANDQVGLLLLESLLLLGYFGLFHPGNQAVLRWGKSPTILHKVCDLPFVFFSDPDLTPILASTLVAACYGCEQNRDVVLQELSAEMLITLLKSCRQGFLTSQSDTLPPDSSLASDQCEGIQLAPEYRRPQGDTPLKLNRRSTRMLLGKGGVSGSNTRTNKVKGQREGRGTKTCDEWALKHNLPALGTSHTFMLHRRFPTSFLDKAEEFFSAESSDFST